MEVEPITYIYLILLVADILCLLLALYKRDQERIPVFVLLAFLFAIGFSANYQVCPFIMCLGATPGQGL